MATGSTDTKKLERSLSLTQATAINMIDMVGIGPFVTLSFIVGAMQGPACILAWLLGAFLAYMDGMVWAELGAKWPEAGGSYVFLQKLFGHKRWGKMLPFLFVWQTTIQAPLVIASGAIGFSAYLTYLVPLTAIAQKAVSGAMVLLVVAMLYRDIKSIGKLSVVLWLITGGTIIWLVLSSIGHFSAAQAFDYTGGLNLSTLFFVALGQASLKAVYSYLGYYNVCHLGAEIKNPEVNIPRSMFISITGIAVLYLCMQVAVLGVLPWKQIADSPFVVSTYFETIYNVQVARVATVLILAIAMSSLFAATLGYSRIPYAAALNGDFFPVFAKVHKRLHFPHVSLLAIGGLAFVFSLLFKLGEVITAIITMRILVQFIMQAVGLIIWHREKPNDIRPYKMPLFPLPAILSIIIWLFILVSSGWHFISIALGIIAMGVVLYFVKERAKASISGE
ncbi:MAG: APC family permease [Flavipsychrobacter sp.]|nr:APC family permease [Flavipsychrobacter sp.]